MNKRKGFWYKKMLSIMIMVVMVIVLLPKWIIEAGGIGTNYTVYFDSSNNTDSANGWNINGPIYVKGFGNGETGLVQMTKVQGNIWEYTFDKNYPKVIFSSKSTFPSEGTNYASQTMDFAVNWALNSPGFRLNGGYGELGKKKAEQSDFKLNVSEEEQEKDGDGEVIFAKSTFYDYYGKERLGEYGVKDDAHYYFEVFNQKVSDYAKVNGMNYPLYFGDFNKAAESAPGMDADRTDVEPLTGQPLNGDIYNYFWTTNRASRTDRNSTTNSSGNKYMASIQGLVSNELDSDGDITQDREVIDDEETQVAQYGIESGKITYNKASNYSIGNYHGKSNVLKVQMDGKTNNEADKDMTFNLQFSGVNTQGKSGYLLFDVYNETEGEADPFIALKDGSGNQMAGWASQYKTTYSSNIMKKGEWSTVCVDLAKLRKNTNPKNGVNNPGSVGNINTIYIGYWTKTGFLNITNIRFADEIETKKIGTVKLPYFNSSFLNQSYSDKGTIGRTTNEMNFPFKRRTKNVSGKECDYYIFTSGKTSYKTQTAGINDVVRINNGNLDYWMGVPDNDSNVVFDMNGVNGWGGATNSPGFFPFNVRSDSSNVSKLNYGFGSKIEIPFTLTKDGKVLSKDGTTRVPMQFNFKGDDDVWVYIDGKLVLDMGGGHTQTTGMIDFASNKAIVDNVVVNDINQSNYNKEKTLASNSLRNPVVKDIKDFTVDNQTAGSYDTDTVHTITVFYMERGMIESNLYMDFNFIPETNKLIVEKEVDTTGVNNFLQSNVDRIAKNIDFEFKLNYKDNESNVKNANFFEYDEKDKDNNITSKVMNGAIFTLKDKYTATFADKFNKGFKVTGIEVEEPRFTTSWITKDLTEYDNSNITDREIASGNGASTTEFEIKPYSEGSYSYLKHYIKFTNKIKTGSISINKEMVTGQTSNEEFEFKLTINEILGEEITSGMIYSGNYTVNGVEKTATNGIIKIKAGETAVITGIPVETKYTLEEIEKEGYEIENLTGDGVPEKDEEEFTGVVTGTITVSNINHTVTYTNKRSVGSITIEKVDENGDVLPGATFKIEKLKEDPDGNIIEGDNKWIVDSTWTSKEDISDVDGKILFDNLDFGTYRITETQAPNGYHILKEPIIITLPYEYEEEEEIDGVTVINNGQTANITLKITNVKGSILPTMGGTGMNQFVILGFLLMALAAGSYVIKAKKKI